MDVARFWRQAWAHVTGDDGQPWRVVRWGWSATSAEEAQARAEASVARTEAAWAQRARDPAGADYRSEVYFANPPREPVIAELTDDRGEVYAVVTRNSYGVLVLNTDRLLFIDIDDRPRPLRKAGAWLARLVGLGGKPATQQDELLARVAEPANAGQFRVYRTAGGWRVARISAPVAGVNDEALATMKAFGADPFYLRLCRRQRTFRARLTPKPWRCGMARPKKIDVKLEPADQARLAAWEAQYNEAAAGYRTCELIAGQDVEIHPALETLVELHDRITRMADQLPLA